MGVAIPNPVVLRGLFSFFESHELSSIVLDRSEQATPSRVGIMKETALYLKKRKQSHNFLFCSDRILTCRIKSIRSPAKGGTGCYRFNYQPGS